MKKMNILYLLALILLGVSVLLLVAAAIVAYVMVRPKLSAVFSVSGAVFAFTGIILALKSKPKNKNDITSI